MLANAIDEPSVLSRSVEACSSPSKAKKKARKTKERRGVKEEWEGAVGWVNGTSMDSDGERGGGRRCKRSTQHSHPCPWFGNTKLEKKTKRDEEREKL